MTMGRTTGQILGGLAGGAIGYGLLRWDVARGKRYTRSPGLVALTMIGAVLGGSLLAGPLVDFQVAPPSPSPPLPPAPTPAPSTVASLRGSRMRRRMR